MKDIKKKKLFNKYPFIMIDKVIQFTINKKIIIKKKLLFNEIYFIDHFPKEKILPGIFILESIMQSMYILFSINNNIKSFFLSSIQKASFKNKVFPGDIMYISVNYIKKKMNFYIFSGIVLVQNKIICNAKLSCFIKI